MLVLLPYLLDSFYSSSIYGRIFDMSILAIATLLLLGLAFSLMLVPKLMSAPAPFSIIELLYAAFFF
jgi:hypothetical protein|tara:strand:- start:111 stop:311 length:201 start_codon:yes stop_codon:yes gene_type:complete